MKNKLTAAVLTGILILGAAASWAGDRLRTRTQTPSSTCTPGSGSMTRTYGGK